MESFFSTVTFPSLPVLFSVGMVIFDVFPLELLSREYLVVFCLAFCPKLHQCACLLLSPFSYPFRGLVSNTI